MQSIYVKFVCLKINISLNQQKQYYKFLAKNPKIGLYFKRIFRFFKNAILLALLLV